MTTANTTATNSWTIVVLDPIPPARAEQLRGLLPPGFALTHGTARGDEHLKAIIAEADFAIAGQVAVSADVFRAAKRLKLMWRRPERSASRSRGRPGPTPCRWRSSPSA
jgi:hypothetical protein